MMQSVAGSLTPRLVAHYARVAPLLDQTLGQIPLVSASFPNGLGQPASWHLALHAPPAVATVQATTPSGTRPYLALAPKAMEWAVQALGALEFHSWTPRADNPSRLAYARVLLELASPAPAGHIDERIARAAYIVRQALHALDLDAIAVRDGGNGIALMLPFDDGPTYDAVRAWLHTFASNLATQNGSLFTTEPNTRGTDLVHIHVTRNAPGAFSVLPYSVRGSVDLPVAVPITWNELATFIPGSVTIDSLPERLQLHGDLLTTERARIGPQRFSSVVQRIHANGAAMPLAAKVETHPSAAPGHVIAAAMQVLGDGVARSADRILAEASARGLLPASFNPKYIYTSLIEYIARAQGNGRRPAIVQNADRSFRINEPPDDWPDLAPAPPLAAPDPPTQALIDRISATARGADSSAFEVAVCDGFAHLGFAATHLGGAKAPDGYADAQLGPLAYRIMIECKTAKGDVSNPDALEAAKFRDEYHAQYCIIIGPAFPDEVELTTELHTHGVAAWTVEDLQTVLAQRADPNELRALFAPGYASDALADLLWNRSHGEAKRLRIIALLLRDAGWNLQVTAAREGAAEQAPHLTADAAMALVDEALASYGASVACSRADIDLVFQCLTNPTVREAVWTDQTQSAIVITRPASTA